MSWTSNSAVVLEPNSLNISSTALLASAESGPWNADAVAARTPPHGQARERPSARDVREITVYGPEADLRVYSDLYSDLVGPTRSPPSPSPSWTRPSPSAARALSDLGPSRVPLGSESSPYMWFRAVPKRWSSLTFSLSPLKRQSASWWRIHRRQKN